MRMRVSLARKAMREKLFYGILLAAALAIVGSMTMPVLIERRMAQYHLRSASYAEWVGLQLLPSMYSFSNHAEVTAENKEGNRVAVENAYTEKAAGRVNHFPLRRVLFEPVDHSQWSDVQIRVRSRLRGQELSSSFVVTHDEQLGELLEVRSETP